jgi:hypothetical protein
MFDMFRSTVGATDLAAMEDGSMTTEELRTRAHDAGRVWRESFLS